MAREPMMVVVDDPNEGFVTMPAEVAQKAGYPQLLGIKPEQVPKDPQKRAAMTALYRERKAARIAREEAAAKELEEKNKPFLEEQARRAEASMAEAAAPKLAKVPAVKALQNIQRFTEAVPATPVAPPEPQIDVSPVGRMDAPAMPRALPMPSAQARPAATPDFAVTPPTRMQAPVVAPAMAPQEEQSEDIAPPSAWDVPPPAPMRVAAPEPERAVVAPTALDIPKAPPPMASEWSRDFSPASTRMPDDEGKALLALAKSQSSAPAGARAAAFAPSAEGIRSMSVPQGYAPEPMASASKAPSAGDEALLKELRDAQRSDGYSAGMRALGDQFRDAMNLILNIQGPKSNMAAGSGGYLDAAKARQALLAAQAKARRDERMTDATVDAKKNAAAKDEAALNAANAKAKKAQDEATRAAALDQPGSPESSRVRELAYQYLGERVGAGGLDKLSGNEIEKVALKFGVPIINAETMAKLSGERNELAGKNAAHDEAVDAARLAQSWASLSLEQQRLLLQQETNKQNAAAKTDEKVDAQTKELQEAYDKAGGPQFYSKYHEASDIMGRYAKDLPGIGALDGNVPERLLSKDGRDLQGAVGQMLAEYRKGITGAGMSEGEKKEYAQITGLIFSNSENAVRQGVERLKRSMDERIQSVAGGYKPEAVARYAGRVPMFGQVIGGGSGRTSPTEAMPTGPDGNPTLDDSQPPSSPRAKPLLPPVGTSSSGVKTVSVKGMKAGDLKKSLSDGETVRYPIEGGQFQVVQRNGDKLLKLRVEGK